MSDIYVTFAESDDLLDKLENDLKAKVIAAMRGANIAAKVEGVFSIDELERKTENEIAVGKLIFGIAYQGLKPHNEAEAPRTNPSHSGGVGMGDYVFSVIIGIRVDQLCKQRGLATRVLSLLRKEIYQSDVQTGKRPEAVRKWFLVQERPEIEDSSDNVLYYSQVWTINLPLKSKSKE